MISSLLSSLKKITVGVEDPSAGEDDNGTESEEEEEGAENTINIPLVQCGITTSREVPPAAVLPDVENKQNEQREDNGVEKIQAIGNITALDPSMVNGVIDRLYQFDIARFCSGNHNFQRGSKVEFEAERTVKVPMWRVTTMKLYESEIEKTNRERRRYRRVVAQVRTIHSDYTEVEVGRDSSRFIKVPNRREFNVGFQWMPGDWMQLHLENLWDDETFNDADLPADITRSKVLSIAPLQKKTIVGKVTKRHQNFLIDDSIYYTHDICKSILPLGAVVRCTAIESNQQIRRGDFVSWRAITVEKSNFLHYTSPDVMTDPDGDWLIDDVGKEVVDRHEELFWDKFGVKIAPRFLKFPPLAIGSSAVKTLTITNTAEQTFRLQKIHFNQDPSVCQFEVKSSQQEPDDAVTFLPKDEVEFQVTCRPMMIGRTTEMCVFDFGQFVIARNLCVVGKSEEEQKLVVEDLGNERPNFRKQIGEADISKVVTDRDRRRIRGCQTIRAPFFSQKRLPLSRVPKEMWQILKDQDETELKRLYPTALEPLRFDNYKDKFAVSLWFEEMENDLRRRQYDLTNVVLTKHGSHSNIFYTFQVLGIQDFQPPVNVQDAIDVFDAENPKNAKFQGTITKLYDTEVTCVFGDAFNEQYTGFPLTVQFCLGRTNYKRCHFAVQTAVDFLGEEFLFPENEVVVKPPRILLYEDDQAKIGQEEVGAEEQKLVAANSATHMSASTVFRKPKPSGQTIFNTKPSSSSNADLKGRRVQSARSRFVSDTPSEPSSGTGKLEWFNSGLNEEQKDAVRRILRGQARPLPYIIYGPPGTGKTVTLVETVMQVNKLDKNSRILVCAPSNAAADIIAEYLANSNQYHPGDFVRLNGFLRSGQTMIESIAPFCTDGEDLINVAMHRLIVATCTTAGQFFSLDLSIGHFTHVFIDEAGYCTEPEALVPAVLLALSKGGQMILAGDPNQLGPVLMSDVAQNCGLNRSMLERLMCRKLYTRDTINFPKEKYNPLVLTKLVKNYRAHQTLLKLPSRLFYDDDLISKASHEEAYALSQDPKLKSILVSQGVPLIFHGVQGLCTRERDSPSWCNKAEAVQVVHYVASLVRNCGLKYEDIGIITPYRKQVEKIRLALQMNLLDDDLPKVASVEEFQGGERKVIIISTVRSVNEDKIDKCLERLGFLYQPKRFNVVITRAKALMIVVGNPHVLSKNMFWLQLLRYAIELNAYKGCNLPIHLDQEIRRFIKQENSTPAKDSDEKQDATKDRLVKQTPETSKTSTVHSDEEFLDEEDGF